MRLSVDIDPAEVARWLGAMGRPLDASLESRLEEAVGAARRIVAPAGVWRRFPVSGGAVAGPSSESASAGDDGGDAAPAGAIVLEGCPLTLPGLDIARHLEGASSVAVMAVTVGIEADREYRRRAVSSQLDALLFSTAAAVAAEAAADALNELIVDEAGCRATSRFSPGYGDLPLAVHPALLAALDASRRLGLTMAESGLLIPTKSITAVIGLFDGLRNATALKGSEESGAAESARPAASAESVRPPASAEPAESCIGCPSLGRCAFAASGTACGRRPSRSRGPSCSRASERPSSELAEPTVRMNR